MKTPTNFIPIIGPLYADDFHKNATSGIFSDPGIKGNDDMITASIGLNPQYRISDRVALNGTVDPKTL